MRINPCFEIQTNRSCIWQEIGFKQRHLLACLFIPSLAVGNNQIVSGKSKGGLEKNWLKGEEERGSSEKVEKFA